MGPVHTLLMAHGRNEAVRRVPANERPRIDVASKRLANERGGLGVIHSEFCLIARSPPKIFDSDEWHRQGHKVSRLIEPGKIPVAVET